MTTDALGRQVPFEDLVGYTLNLEGDFLVATRPNSETLYFCSSDTTDAQWGYETVRNVFLNTRPYGLCGVQGNFDGLNGKTVASVRNGVYRTLEAVHQGRPISVNLEVNGPNCLENYVIRPKEDYGIECFRPAF
jgi:hypothetical protein